MLNVATNRPTTKVITLSPLTDSTKPVRIAAREPDMVLNAGRKTIQMELGVRYDATPKKFLFWRWWKIRKRYVCAA